MKFKFLVELPDVNFLCISSFHRFLNEELQKLFAKRINSFSVFEKGNCRIYLNDKDWKVVNELLFKDFLSDPCKIIDYHKTIAETSESYFKFCREFQKNDFSGFSNKGLVDIFERFYASSLYNLLSDSCCITAESKSRFQYLSRCGIYINFAGAPQSHIFQG